MWLRTVFAAGFVSIILATQGHGATLLAAAQDWGGVGGSKSVWPHGQVFESPEDSSARVSVARILDTVFRDKTGRVPMTPPPAVAPFEARKSVMRVAYGPAGGAPGSAVTTAQNTTQLVDVPVPMAGLLMMSAFGMLGLMARRDRVRLHRERAKGWMYARPF